MVTAFTLYCKHREKQFNLYLPFLFVVCVVGERLRETVGVCYLCEVVGI